MDKMKAGHIRELLNELDKFNEQLKWLTENNRGLYLGVKYKDDIFIDKIGKYDFFSSMLKRHYEMMIKEMEESISSIEKDIEEL